MANASAVGAAEVWIGAEIQANGFGNPWLDPRVPDVIIKTEVGGEPDLSDRDEVFVHHQAGRRGSSTDIPASHFHHRDQDRRARRTEPGRSRRLPIRVQPLHPGQSMRRARLHAPDRTDHRTGPGFQSTPVAGGAAGGDSVSPGCAYVRRGTKVHAPV